MATEREEAEGKRTSFEERQRPKADLILRALEPYRPWLQNIPQQIARRRWLKTTLEAIVMSWMLALGVDSLVKFEWRAAAIGLSIGLLLAVVIFRHSFTDPEFELDYLLVVCVSAPFVLKAADNLQSSERLSALLEFCIGIPMLVIAANLSSRPSRRQHILYSCGTFLGTMVGYHFIIVWGGAEIGLPNNLGWAGYLIAAAIGLVLAIEMPLTYRTYRGKNRPTKPSTKSGNRNQAVGTPSMVPLTFTIGIIMGLTTILVFFALSLLLYWPVGYVLVPALGTLIFYGLRPR